MRGEHPSVAGTRFVNVFIELPLALCVRVHALTLVLFHFVLGALHGRLHALTLLGQLVDVVEERVVLLLGLNKGIHHFVNICDAGGVLRRCNKQAQQRSASSSVWVSQQS